MALDPGAREQACERGAEQLDELRLGPAAQRQVEQRTIALDRVPVLGDDGDGVGQVVDERVGVTQGPILPGMTLRLSAARRRH
jgi:hypothetical protein